MNAGITPFSFEGFAVRVIQISGGPWFVAADVCSVLGLDDTSKACSRLDDDERGTSTVRTPSGEQQMLVINESGLYSLILTSRKPSAKKFKRWVTGEVLPSIRKTGGYGIQAPPPAALTTMDILKLAMVSEEGRLAAVAQLAIVEPKAAALDLISTADGMLGLQAAGRALQQHPNKFVAWLRENGWIYKRAGSANNCARAEKFNAGYLATKANTVIQPDGTERVREQCMVTGKGLAKLALIFGVVLGGGLVGGV